MTDVIFGGLSYWLIGYGLSYGSGKGSNEFFGNGLFLTDADHDEMGAVFSNYFFQLSFATTATTIVSGLFVSLFIHQFYFMFRSTSFVLTRPYNIYWLN